MPLDETVECPLCMEPLDVDDLNFFPCTCGYQICRFCWHRIRTDENSLCPACRKQYQEDPAEFKPLSEDELTKIKKERKQKDMQRKQKAAENRRHLANIRVVQKNLVFVVGLSNRLADPEVLKRHEYFGKFGKIVKVVINQSTSYAGAQGPSASAYITYTRPEDCLRAIQAVSNVFVEGRTLKASLGTTKYCSHFLKGSQCSKPDCMYLHELGDEEASFTKEEMQAGKHQEYEQKLVQLYLTNSMQSQPTSIPNIVASVESGKQTTNGTAPPGNAYLVPQSKQPVNTRKKVEPSSPAPSSNKEPWPLLSTGTRNTNQSNISLSGKNNESEIGSISIDPHDTPTVNGFATHNGFEHSPESSSSSSSGPRLPTPEIDSPHTPLPLSSRAPVDVPPLLAARRLPFSDSTDSQPVALLGSNNGFTSYGGNVFTGSTSVQATNSLQTRTLVDNMQLDILLKDGDNIGADWHNSFPFGASSSLFAADDDLGFDPFLESNKGLADMLQSETATFSALSLTGQHHQTKLPTEQMTNPMATGFGGVMSSSAASPLGLPTAISGPSAFTLPPPPPGLSGPTTPNNFAQAFPLVQEMPLQRGSRMLGLMNLSQQTTQMPAAQSFVTSMSAASLPGRSSFTEMRLGGHQQVYSSNVHIGRGDSDFCHTQDWREGLKALLPNIPINFASASPMQTHTLQNSRLRNSYMNTSSHVASWNGHSTPTKSPNLEDQFFDPAIVSGCLSTDTASQSPPGVQPHWLQSIQQLTETDSPVKPVQQLPSTAPFRPSVQPHSRMPFAQNIQISAAGTNGWPSLQTHNPPPGFHTAFRNQQQSAHMATLES